ncbi:DUF4280 domain-containing protein [Paludibacterium purpuratum]|uniref:Uncharacterized protein DUF4280 n=1 Tax=Paludibacterium purpuratum TaxID=1144873 RepID=A0A4R7B6D1_9NEIS|nr:DUF4280 domain-containing protein [Paludibacterium purpuratum]TDR78365.1 uncharacterized protein DUF4280 [Paludibacterium purpuratum]
MSLMVANGALLTCSFSMPPLPTPLKVLPLHRVLVENQPAANIRDHVPEVNITSFGMCMAPANPAVIAATAAAMGVPTPVPCVPVTPAPWLPGVPTVLVDKAPALDMRCRCLCQWAGVISIVFPRVTRTMVP